MNKNCENCQYWGGPEEDDWSYEDIKFDRDVNYKNIGEAHVHKCWHPKLVFYERPAKDGACVVDGSQYVASLLTGPLFGCVNFTEAIRAQKGE
jgi:hypothetical protein